MFFHTSCGRRRGRRALAAAAQTVVQETVVQETDSFGEADNDQFKKLGGEAVEDVDSSSEEELED